MTTFLVIRLARVSGKLLTHFPTWNTVQRTLRPWTWLWAGVTCLFNAHARSSHYCGRIRATLTVGNGVLSLWKATTSTLVALCVHLWHLVLFLPVSFSLLNSWVCSCVMARWSRRNIVFLLTHRTVFVIIVGTSHLHHSVGSYTRQWS
jgi:hypothetical protein